MSKTKKLPKADPYGLHPNKNTPEYKRERIEIDYADKLSPEDKKWLARFNDYWGSACDLKAGTKGYKKHKEKCPCSDCEDRRAVDRDIKAQKHDWWAQGPLEHPDTNDPEKGEITWDEIADGQNREWRDLRDTDEQKEAREKARKLTPPPPKRKREKTPPKTPEHRKAVRDLINANLKSMKDDPETEK